MTACRAQISPHLLAFITLGIRFCLDVTRGVGRLGGNSENDKPSGLPLGDRTELRLAPTQGQAESPRDGGLFKPEPLRVLTSQTSLACACFLGGRSDVEMGCVGLGVWEPNFPVRHRSSQNKKFTQNICCRKNMFRGHS